MWLLRPTCRRKAIRLRLEGHWQTKGILVNELGIPKLATKEWAISPTTVVTCTNNCTTESLGHLHDWKCLITPPTFPHKYQTIGFCFYNLGRAWATRGSSEALSSSTRIVNRTDLLGVNRWITAVVAQDGLDQSDDITVFFSRTSMLISIATVLIYAPTCSNKGCSPRLSHPSWHFFFFLGWPFWLRLQVMLIFFHLFIFDVGACMSMCIVTQ